MADRINEEGQFRRRRKWKAASEVRPEREGVTFLRSWRKGILIEGSSVSKLAK